jgi:hypothetical protein
MPIALDGGVTPLRIVFGIDAAVLPAAFGLLTASALAIGTHKISAIVITLLSSDFPLISIDGSSCQVG